MDKTLIQIDTKNSFLRKSMEYIIESIYDDDSISFKLNDCQELLPSVIFTDEASLQVSKRRPRDGVGHPVVVQIRNSISLNSAVLYPCTSNELCMFHDDSLDVATSIIDSALRISQKKNVARQYCFRCKSVYLTCDERLFLTYFLNSIPPRKIAILIGRSIKTISSRKRSIMRKLNLESDWQLFHYFNQRGGSYPFFEF